MKKILCWVGISYVLCLLVCCSTKNTDGEVPYNPYVEAFTSGKISRYTPVYLIFNQDIAEDKRDAGRLSRLIHIKPNVEGSFSFENSRTIVFKPAKAFERDETYRLTADLSEWFDAEKENREFAFRFSTLPLALRANLETLNVNAKNENGYDVTCTVMTPDKESPETVEMLVCCKEKAAAVWQHSPDGRKHQVTYQNIPAGTEGERDFELYVPSNKSGAAAGSLLSFSVPGMNDFGVYDVTYVTEPERFVEVTFTKTLDASQDMHGLAFISGNTSETVTVEGNRLRLYPDAGREGSVNVHLAGGIRSRSGMKLGEDIVRQVDIDTSKPDVRFVGQGVVIPQSSELRVPFQAVYLRGVVVRVIKILEQNIGVFLQENNLDGTADLMRAGRLVARKTVFFDDDGKDLTTRNTYAIDLKELMEPEQGAIYRVELSFGKELSVYPCDDTKKPSREQILADDEIKFKEEVSRFDDGGYYYYNGGYDWSNYKYNERNDPCSDSYYYNKVVGRNVLSTNIGLIAKAGEGDEMIVMAHNLLTAMPEGGVKIVVYNYQHQQMASGSTAADGMVKLRLSKGKPFYLIASLGGERSYLRIDAGSSLSLSSFDVAGEVLQKGIKGFIYGDRGVWRPGDTLHLGFMLADKDKKLPKSHPVVMELYNPLGQLYLRKTSTRGIMGVYSFDMPTASDAPTGAWNVSVKVGGATFQKRLRVETIKPNRLKIDLNMPQTVLLRGESLDASLHTEWLQGATARNLKYDIQGTFTSTATTFAGYKGFTFDDPSKVFAGEETKIISGTTDDRGNAHLKARFDVGTTAPGMLSAGFVTRVYEESGNFSIDATRRLYSPYRRYVGIKSPQHTQAQLATGKPHNFEVASVDYSGKPAANTSLDINVYKLYWYWWWDAADRNLAGFVSDSYNKPVKQLNIKTGDDGLATFSLAFDDEDWGTYFISVKDKDGKHSTGVMSYFDVSGYEGRRDMGGSSSANMLTFKTDKDTYKPGDKMTVTFPSSSESRAIVSVENGVKVLSVREYSCTGNLTTVHLDVTPEMQPNAYVHISLLQPHGTADNDHPIRMYGIVPFKVESADSHLHPEINIPAEIRPEEEYEVVVSEKNRREMAYTLAVVDEGLLDLTHFRTPDPWQAFNAREALGVNTWDMYNYVVGAYGGRIEQLFSVGGDDALIRGRKAVVNRFKPVVEFHGPFHIGKGDKGNRHRFVMPNYNGRVRVMVVASGSDAYGSAEKSSVVRKPVMLLGTLPRVIGIGEEMTVPATVFATEDGVGDVAVSIRCSDNMEIVGKAAQTLHFSKKGDAQAMFRIRVKDRAGAAHVTLSAEGRGEKAHYDTDIEIRSVTQAEKRVQYVTIEPGKAWEGDVKLFGTEGTNTLALELSNVPPLNLNARLSFLASYPHECLEQLTSKAFPLLYVSSFSDMTKAELSAAEESVRSVISRLASYQTVDGAFSYWSGGTSSSAWGTVYATHFLLSAEAKGYLVPDGMRHSALGNLSRVAREWKSAKSPYALSEEVTEAYRLYVLALASASELGAMNRLKENASLSFTASRLLASAYVLVGRADVAKEIVSKTRDVTATDYSCDLTFGSDLRCDAISLMAMTLLDAGKEASQLASEVSASLTSDTWQSTQSTAFAIVALAHYMEKYKTSDSMAFTYTIDGKTKNVDTKKNIWRETLLSGADEGSRRIAVKNTGSSTIFAGVSTEGTAAQGSVSAYANGLSVAVSYTDLGGHSLDVSKLTNGTNFVAVATVKNTTSRGITGVVLTQVFPSGWEILATQQTEDKAPRSDAAAISHQDVRDDRVYSYIDLLPAGTAATVRINLAAVYSGQFYLPPVRCEAMYDNSLQSVTAAGSAIVE